MRPYFFTLPFKYLLFLLLIFSSSSYAQNVKSLNYLDDTSHLTISQVMHLSQEWQHIETTHFVQNAQIDPIWIKLELKTYKAKDFFHIQSESLYLCDLFQVKDQHIIKQAHLGMNAYKHTPDLYISSHFIPLGKGVDTLYLRVQAIPSLSISFDFLSKAQALKHAELNTLSNGLFFGILLFLLLYNLILYLYTKFQPFLPYLVYLIGLLLYFLFIDTQYIHTLWPYETLSLGPFFQFSISLSYIGMFLFPLVLLNISTKYPKMYKVLVVMLLILVAMEVSLAYLWYVLDFELYNFLYVYESVLVIALFITLLILSLHLALKGDKLALYYFLAWSILFVGLGNYIVQYTFSVDNLFLAQQFFRLSVVIEGLLFSFILAYRIKELEILEVEYEKSILQRTYNKEMGTMLNEVSHQWRQPLNAINALIFEQVVQDKRPEKEAWIKTLNEIEDLTSYLSNTIEDFQYPYEALDLNEDFLLHMGIDKALQLLSTRLKGVNVSTTDVDTALQVNGSMNHFTQVLLILLNNALNAYSMDQTSKTLIFKATKLLDVITVEIEDNAGGIADEITERLGDPFVTSKEEHGNKGIGLYMAKKILENNFNATLEIVSTKNKTRCLIRLAHAK